MLHAELHGKPVIGFKAGVDCPCNPLAHLSRDLCADSWVCNQLQAQNQLKETLQIKFHFVLCFN